MQQPGSDIANKLNLLLSIDMDEVAELAARTVEATAQAAAVAIVMWDPDLESFTDKYFSGARKKELLKFCESFADHSQVPEETFTELEVSDYYQAKFPKELEPVYCLRLEHKGDIVACILIAGSACEEEQLAGALTEYPLNIALHNAWRHRELQRENNRLRSQYEEMEGKTTLLEHQTREVIQELTVHDTIRTRQVERERLVYWISNAVRSSVHIQQVLETTVEKIGTTLKVTRCLILRSVDTADQLNVFEYCENDVEQAKRLFYSDAGLRFTGHALLRKSPHEVVLDDSEDRTGYDQNFLALMGIRSGLIVPLVMREQVLGVLFLQDCLRERNWSIDDVSLIGSLADHLSVAIENADLHQERERQAVTDGLTGIANRRSFNETFAREFERARRYGEPLSLVVADLDLLKKINDTYGHQAGDEAIKTIGRLLKQSSRSIDLAARYGGEEFCLLLPNTEIEMAEQLAERLRRLIHEVDVEGPGHISASLGVANYPLHADEPDALFQKADEALYAAKQGGRNQVRVAGRNGGKPVPTGETHSKDIAPGAPGTPPADTSSRLLT